MNRTIYILLTRSGTVPSRLIHFFTSDSYTHVSIGLDGPLGRFYSFARKYEHFALPGGLVEEQVRRGFFRRHPQTPCRLYKLKVSQAVYDRLKERLGAMYAQRDLYHYNLLGTMSLYFHWPIRRRYHFFCSQFVARVLQECGAARLPKVPELTRPADFCQLKGLIIVYQGVVGGIPSTVV